MLWNIQTVITWRHAENFGVLGLQRKSNPWKKNTQVPAFPLDNTSDTAVVTGCAKRPYIHRFHHTPVSIADVPLTFKPHFRSQTAGRAWRKHSTIIAPQPERAESGPRETSDLLVREQERQASLF